MDKIELRIMGGLGNQLYQYSAARFLQKKYNVKQIVIDSGEYDTYKVRNLEINQLLHNERVGFENVRSAKNALYREFYHIYQKLYRMLIKKRPLQMIYGNDKDKYLCTYINCDLSTDLSCENLYLYGYFVSADIAISIREELMKEISLLDECKSNNYQDFLEKVESNSCIAVSIRCAEDYVKNNWPICSKLFYQRGIEYILKKQIDKSSIMIFADDIEKVKKETWFSEFENVIYVEGLSVCESFEIMRRCKDYVCSNSSFSWWGAFLSYSENPTRINPNKVFSGDSGDIDQLTFYKNLIFLDYKTGEIQHEICSSDDSL